MVLYIFYLLLYLTRVYESQVLERPSNLRLWTYQMHLRTYTREFSEFSKKIDDEEESYKHGKLLGDNSCYISFIDAYSTD